MPGERERNTEGLLRAVVRGSLAIVAVLRPALPRCELTQKQGVQQQRQVHDPVFSHTVVHHHLCHEDHGYVAPIVGEEKPVKILK